MLTFSFKSTGAKRDISRTFKDALQARKKHVKAAKAANESEEAYKRAMELFRGTVEENNVDHALHEILEDMLQLGVVENDL